MARYDFVNNQTAVINDSSLNGVSSRALPKSKEIVTARQLPLSKTEKKIITFAGALLACFLIMVVSVKINLSTSQHQLERMQEKVTALSNKNTIMKQEVSQLSDQTQLNQVAKKAGLSLNSENIRNVSK